MSKREFSESMADVLGWEYYPDALNKGRYFIRYMGKGINRSSSVDFGNNGIPQLIETIEDFIFSPEGFFAVWDKLEEIDRHKCFCLLVDAIVSILTKGTDRYIAFYSAVHEMKN